MVNMTNISAERKVFGSSGSLNYRMLLLDIKGNPTSFWNSVPLFTPNGQLNFLCMTPKDSWLRHEIGQDEAFSPLQVTRVRNKPARYARNASWNCGILPQTWGDPEQVNEDYGGFRYDSCPIEVIDIGSRPSAVGSIYAVKPLTAFAVIRTATAQLSWKVVVIAADDPVAGKLNDAADIGRLLPGTISSIREWLRTCTVVETGDRKNVFGLNERAAGLDVTVSIIAQAHSSWQLLDDQRQNGDLYAVEAVDALVTYEKQWARSTQADNDLTIPCAMPDSAALAFTDSEASSRTSSAGSISEVEEMKSPVSLKDRPLLAEEIDFKRGKRVESDIAIIRPLPRTEFDGAVQAVKAASGSAKSSPHKASLASQPVFHSRQNVRIAPLPTEVSSQSGSFSGDLHQGSEEATTQPVGEQVPGEVHPYRDVNSGVELPSSPVTSLPCLSDDIDHEKDEFRSSGELPLDGGPGTSGRGEQQSAQPRSIRLPNISGGSDEFESVPRSSSSTGWKDEEGESLEEEELGDIPIAQAVDDAAWLLEQFAEGKISLSTRGRLQRRVCFSETVSVVTYEADGNEVSGSSRSKRGSSKERKPLPVGYEEGSFQEQERGFEDPHHPSHDRTQMPLQSALARASRGSHSVSPRGPNQSRPGRRTCHEDPIMRNTYPEVPQPRKLLSAESAPGRQVYYDSQSSAKAAMGDWRPGMKNEGEPRLQTARTLPELVQKGLNYRKVPEPYASHLLDSQHRRIADGRPKRVQQSAGHRAEADSLGPSHTGQLRIAENGKIYSPPESRRQTYPQTSSIRRPEALKSLQVSS